MKMRVVNGTVTDLSEDPARDYSAEVAKDFIEVPNDAPSDLKIGYKYDPVTKVFTAPEPPFIPLPLNPEPQFNMHPTPPQFFLLFTAQERVAIKYIAKGDYPVSPILEDWLEILNDPRLTEVDLTLESTQNAIMFLTTVEVPESLFQLVGFDKVLQPFRAEVILRGVPA